MIVGKQEIISEYPFSHKQREKLYEINITDYVEVDFSNTIDFLKEDLF